MAVSVQERFDFVPTHLVVKAMRDSGYKNAAYAIAELMDNSIQAGATSVELLCAETELQLQQRRRRRLEQIAVLDNGSGMDENTLRMALQFGNGRHLGATEGMGKFGMGLPNSSVSQCMRVDVWTWQDGIDSALHTHLDIQEILDGRTEVPEPSSDPVPELWKRSGTSFGRTGTLVVWSRLDRIMWRTALSVIKNSEFLIGRMYRRFIDDGSVAIRMASFLIDRPDEPVEDSFARVNDPMYLMANTSTPEPYAAQPMFEPFGGDSWEVPFELADLEGDVHTVTVRFSAAKQEAREARPGELDPGARPYGKHAANNIGVSLVRAGRELDLDTTLAIPYDPVERWWGVEVEFPPALDELFGVTNNKQAARNFTDASRLDISGMLRGKTVSQLKEEMVEDGDPLAPLLEIVHRIESTLSQMRKLLKLQTRGARGRRRHDPSGAEAQATTATRERQAEGHTGRSDQQESDLDPEARQKEIEQELVEEGVPEREAHERAWETVSSGLKYVFNVAEIESSAFFSVKPRAGTIFVTLNATHPAYKHLVHVTEDLEDGADVAELRERLSNANKGLKLVLAAWARYEDEQPTDRLREQAQDIRTDWGRVARQFLSLDR